MFMDSLVQALLIITVPLDLGIICAGAYLIRAYSHEQAQIREAAHDAEITQRELIRERTALIKSGQYQPPEPDMFGQLIAAVGPKLMEGLAAKVGPQAGVSEQLQQEKQHG